MGSMAHPLATMSEDLRHDGILLRPTAYSLFKRKKKQEIHPPPCMGSMAHPLATMIEEVVDLLVVKCVGPRQHKIRHRLFQDAPLSWKHSMLQ